MSLVDGLVKISNISEGLKNLWGENAGEKRVFEGIPTNNNGNNNNRWDKPTKNIRLAAKFLSCQPKMAGT